MYLPHPLMNNKKKSWLQLEVHVSEPEKLYSLVLRPHSLRGKRVWWFRAVFLVWLALGARDDTAGLEQSSDLIGQQCHVGDSNLYSGQWCFYIPVVSESYMYDCDKAVIWLVRGNSSTGRQKDQAFSPKSPDPFPRERWGLGTRLEKLWFFFLGLRPEEVGHA